MSTSLYYGFYGTVRVVTNQTSVEFTARSNGTTYTIPWVYSQSETAYNAPTHLRQPTSVTRVAGATGYLFVRAAEARGLGMPINPRYEFWQQPHFVQMVWVTALSGTIATVTGDGRTYRADFSDATQVNTLTDLAAPGKTTYQPIATNSAGIPAVGTGGNVAWSADFVRNNNITTGGLPKWPDGFAVRDLGAKLAAEDASGQPLGLVRSPFIDDSYAKADDDWRFVDDLTKIDIVATVTIDGTKWATTGANVLGEHEGKQKARFRAPNAYLLKDWVVHSGYFK